ncbi:hypothetical protein [Streptosporangium sp. NPDC087985]|uniref:hypothetical protein n=1 Tax=Streptosporangium sp. NPDC087985 TaxID=3366196 RepID=UPI00380751C4
MSPELHLQMIINRNAELHEQAANHRRALQAEAARKNRAEGERRRSFFGKINAA